MRIGPGDYNRHTRLRQITDERELELAKDPGCADCGCLAWKVRGWGKYTIKLCDHCFDKCALSELPRQSGS